jgi:hypothetical protein
VRITPGQEKRDTRVGAGTPRGRGLRRCRDGYVQPIIYNSLTMRYPLLLFKRSSETAHAG